MPVLIVDRIRKAVDSRRGQSVDLLRSLVEVNSFSGNPEGLNRVGELVLESLPGILGIRSETDGNGVRHHVVTGPMDTGKKTLMLGHLDTVFPPGDNRNPFRRAGKKILGPGTADMKGGIVVMAQSLRILEDLGLLGKIPLECIFNCDEEVASPFSEKLIRDAAGRSSRGLVFESGGPGGKIVTARRGVARLELTVTGRAGHAGGMKEPKASAILVLARKITELEDLNDRERGISLNVGTVTGGQATNIIPDSAASRLEYRFWKVEDEEEIRREIGEIAARTENSDCGAFLRDLNRRPGMVPVPGSEELVRLVTESAALMGQTIGTERRGGASDGNYLSEMGLPVVDGFGPVGDMDHSPEEFIVEGSLHDRIELTALLLCRLAGIEG